MKKIILMLSFIFLVSFALASQSYENIKTTYDKENDRVLIDYDVTRPIGERYCGICEMKASIKDHKGNFYPKPNPDAPEYGLSICSIFINGREMLFCRKPSIWRQNVHKTIIIDKLPRDIRSGFDVYLFNDFYEQIKNPLKKYI